MVVSATVVIVLFIVLFFGALTNIMAGQPTSGRASKRHIHAPRRSHTNAQFALGGLGERLEEPLEDVGDALGDALGNFGDLGDFGDFGE